MKRIDSTAPAAAGDETPPVRRDTPHEVLPELIGTLRPRLWNVLRRHRIPFQDAEDVVQGALLLLVREWGAVRDPAAWLIGTLHRCSIQYWRRRRPEDDRRVLVDQLPEVLVDGDQERRVLRNELNSLARQLLGSRRRLIYLRYQLGMADPEIAAATGLQPDSVRKLISRALARMRQQALAFRPVTNR